MIQADCVHSTPPTNTSSPQPCLPPPVGVSRQVPYSADAEASEDRHPLAHLIRLRDDAAAEVERLLAFLDATDGCEDLAEVCEDEGAPTGDDEDGLDGEPSLGWTIDGQHGSGMLDCEDEHDGREPDPDNEDGGDYEPIEYAVAAKDVALQRRFKDRRDASRRDVESFTAVHGSDCVPVVVRRLA